MLLGKGMHVMFSFFSMSSCIRMLRFLQNLAPKKKYEFMVSLKILYDLVEFVFPFFFWIVCGRTRLVTVILGLYMRISES